MPPWMFKAWSTAGSPSPTPPPAIVSMVPGGSACAADAAQSIIASAIVARAAREAATRSDTRETDAWTAMAVTSVLEA
jgi:hypothetical protein